MKTKVNIWVWLVIALLFFSFISGCKLVHRLTSKSKSSKEVKTSAKLDVAVNKSDSSSLVKTDTSKASIKTSTRSSNKKITEITIELDSSKEVSADSSKKDPIDRLVDAALKRAKSIQVRVEQQQDKETHREETVNNQKHSSGTQVKKDNSVVNASGQSEQKATEKKSDANIKRDGTVETNLGSLWWLLVLPLAIAGYLIYRRFK